MARMSRRRGKKRVRYFSSNAGSSSEADGGGSGGSDEEREESEKQERRWQLRRSTLESRAKGKQVVEDDMSLSSSSDETSEDEAEGEWETQQSQEQQQPHEEGVRQEVPHSSGTTPKEEICGICLSEGGERGKLDCCDHFFCFACIMEWAKVESRCPMCKQRFVTVLRPANEGVSRTRTRSFRIPTRDQVYEPSEEEIRLFTDPYQNTVCTECQEAGDEGLLLLCDRCDGAAHTYCVGLGRSVPRGDWFCQACQAIELDSSDSENGEEVAFDTTDIDEEEGSVPESILAMIVGDVQPNLFPRTRRSASQRRVPLRRSSRRRVRRSSLSDSSALTDALMITMTSTSERRGFFPSQLDTHPARTLSHQRQVQATVQNRLQNMRENWNRYRSGEVQFGSVGHSVESSRPGSAAGGGSFSTPRLGRSTPAAAVDENGGETRNVSQTTRGTGRAAASEDMEQAWANMERARRLEGSTAGPSQPVAPSRLNSASDRRSGEVRPLGTPIAARTRERTHQSETTIRGNSSRVPPLERHFHGDDLSRFNSSRTREEYRANSARNRDERQIHRRGWTDSAGEGLDLANLGTSNGRHLDRRESSRQNSIARASENGNVDILSGADNSRGRYHLRESNRLHLSRTGNHPEDNAVTTGSRRSPSKETRTGTEGLTLRSILEDKDSSRGSGGVTTRSREAKETQMSFVQSILDDKDNSRGSVGVMTRWREAKDAQALQGRSILDDKENSRSSTGPIIRRELDRNRSHFLSRGRAQSASRNPNRDEEMKVLKAQCSDLVKHALEPILVKGTIDKTQFKELARTATHTILSSLGVPGLKHEIDVVAVGTITCDHEQQTSSSLIPGCCTPCVQRHVKRYVKSLVKETLQSK